MNAPVGRFAFAEPASLSLLDKGKLDPRWIGALFALPPAPRTDESIWEPGFFALRHFVSTYLPIRYWGWARLDAATAERDSAGLPKAEWNLATAPRLTWRTQTELLLMRSRT